MPTEHISAPPTSEQDSWLTRKEVSARLKVPEKTVAYWGLKGPKYAKIGRFVRYRLSDVVAWEDAQFGGSDAA
ncbi:helix-turn-helix transcriptional regulator [Rhodococcus sp. 114MFTsu3.1]|uniref:helix-turn-helix transcriptional regulator n=1 Tax=Rhodococcus sp. 114MFTsu3.1 TaxID=1172184 RepID=UPI00037724DF|nr:helix-turn-helix domain-containing protein [Rhodococcus sp. 114MFTsu3.1]